MEEDRPEYAEAIQVGKRRSSLGALSKSKPVTKLKSMFEAKGPAPKMKDPGLLGKLKPISVSHDGSSFAAAVSSSLAQKFPFPPPPEQQPPATPSEPLFSVLPPPAAEQDVLPIRSPPRSVDDLRTSTPGFNSDSMQDGSEADARSAKSPGSAGFLKRMGSSIKKALTPKSSAGKHKHGGCSPSYAGSDASNLSPRPSGQLLMTPTSQPSSTSLDLNCRSDQLQSAPPRSPSALMGYEVRSSHEDQEWARSSEGIEIASRPIPSSGRPPRSPSVTPPSVGAHADGASSQFEASPRSASCDVAPRMPSAASPDQSQVLQGAMAAGAPMAPEDSFVSVEEANGSAAAGSTRGAAVDGEDNFAASLTASPTVPAGSEASGGSPPMREVNMGAAIFSPPPFPMPCEHGADAGEAIINAPAGELVFPSLPSSDLPGEMARISDVATASAGAPLVAESVVATSAAEPLDVDMAASDTAAPSEEPPATAVCGDAPPSAGIAAADTSAEDSSMEVDGGAERQEPPFHQPMPLASRRSFGAAASLNLDLTEAVAAAGSPSSPDATTPTGEGNNATDRCIIGLTPVRPDTAAMGVMHVDTPVLSTVAEDSLELPSPPQAMELRTMDLESDFNQADGAQEMDVELAPRGIAATAVEPVPCAQESPCAVVNAPAAPEETRASESLASQPPYQKVQAGGADVAAAPQTAAADMDWDDNAADVPCAAGVSSEALQKSGSTSGAAGCLPTVTAVPAEVPASAVCEKPLDADIIVPFTEPQDATEPPTAYAAEPVSGAASSHDQPVCMQQLDAAGRAQPEASGPEPVEEPATEALGSVMGAESEGAPEQTLPAIEYAPGQAAAVMGEEQASEVSVPAGPADIDASSSSMEERPENACAVDHPEQLPEASADATVLAAPVLEEVCAAAAPEALTAETEEAPAPVEPAVAAAETAPAMALADAVAEGVSPVQKAAAQHTQVPDLVNEPRQVSGLPQPELDINMEDAGLAGAPPIATSDHAVASDLPASPAPEAPVDAEPITVPSPTASLDTVMPGDGAPGDVVGCMPADGCSPGGPAQEEALAQWTPVEQPNAVADDLAAPADEATPDSNAPEQPQVVETAAPDVARLPAVDMVTDAAPAAPCCDVDGGKGEDHGDALQASSPDDGATALLPDNVPAESSSGANVTVAEQSAAPEHAVAEPGPSPVEPQQPMAFHMAAVEAAAAADTSSTAVHQQQPFQADTDLMDVDSSAVGQLPSSPEGGEEGGAAAPAPAPAFDVEPERASGMASPACQPTSEQPVASEVAMEPLQQSPKVAAAAVAPTAVGAAEGGPAAGSHLRQPSTDQSMEHDFVALGSTTGDMSFLDAAIATRVLADPVYAALTGAAEAAPAAAPASPAQTAAAETASTVLGPAPAASQPDDPMMVSPMPPRLSMLPPALRLAPEQTISQASPQTAGGSAPPSAAPSAGTPGMPTPISPETARLGVRAFQLDDIEEPEVAVAEATATTEALMQEQAQLPSGGDYAPAEKPDSLPPAVQSASPVVGGTAFTAAESTSAPADTEDSAMASVEGSILPATPVAAAAPDFSAPTATTNVPASADSVPSTHAAPSIELAPASDMPVFVPSVSAPSPAAPAGIDVPMADSLEAIEALWGNDDLLATPGSDAAGAVPLPQIASSPVSASKQSESPVLAHSGRKVAPGVVLQVQRESLDLFSLRNSCAARVSDSLMVESLDSFENMGLCAKSRAVGFVPMAPLKEGDEDAAAVGRTSGSEGGSAPTSAGQPSPDVTFAVNTRGSPDSVATPGFGAAASTSTAADTPSANKPAACNAGARGGAQTPAAAAASSQVKASASALKSAIPGSAVRPNATPSTALKAMAAANAAGPSASKPGVPKRALPAAAPPAKPLLTPGQPAAASCVAPSASRLPGFAATPGTGATRVAAATPTAKLAMPSQAAAATPGAAPGRPGVTPRTGGVFTALGQQPAAGVSRPGTFAQQPVPAGRTASGVGLFDTPVILRAAAVPLADTPFSVGDFDLDISAEASKAIAMLGGGDSNLSAAAASGTITQHATPVLASLRGVPVAGTPTLSVLETHVQLLTNKLAEAEASILQLQDENAMLRDQLSTLQFESSMTNDLDIEREARQFLEQELAVIRHRADGLEAGAHTAAQEIKRHQQAAAELLAVQQTKEAEWARREAEMELRMQQMAAEVEVARNFAQQADARISEAEARAAAATAKCDEETSRSRELQVTLGLQAHQLVQLQRSRDDESAKFQKAMQQLIAAQTSQKKVVVEYEQRIQQASAQVQQYNELRERYRQLKAQALENEQRALDAEAKVQEANANLNNMNLEKAELMRMCNQLLTQLEATKAKGGR